MAQSKSTSGFSIDPNGVYAVLTGDVVASSDLEPAARRKLPGLLESAAKEMPPDLAARLPYRLAVFSGDSWQVLVAEPARALRVALFIRAFLRAQLTLACDTRISIGIGGVDFVPRGDVRKAEGEAFRLSGRGLEALEGRIGLRLHVERDARAAGWDAALIALDALIRNVWTPARARAVSGTLRGWTQEQIAELWDEPIKQSTVSARLAEAEWDAVELVLERWQAEWGRA